MDRQAETTRAPFRALMIVLIYNVNGKLSLTVKSYHAGKVTWLWPSLKYCKDHRKVTIELLRDIDVENILIKVQQDLSTP